MCGAAPGRCVRDLCEGPRPRSVCGPGRGRTDGRSAAHSGPGGARECFPSAGFASAAGLRPPQNPVPRGTPKPGAVGTQTRCESPGGAVSTQRSVRCTPLTRVPEQRSFLRGSVRSYPRAEQNTSTEPLQNAEHVQQSGSLSVRAN